MKKAISLLLLTTFILAIFSSCSTSEVTLMEFVDNTENIIDMRGKTVTVCSENDLDEVLFEQKVNTVMYDAILDRFGDMEKTYNMDIELISYDGTPDMIARLQNLASTGETHIDVLYGHGYNKIGKLAYSGVLYPLTDLRDYIDYTNSEKFGSAGLLEAAMIDGIPYAVQPVQWIGFANSFAFHIVWNTEKFAQFGLPNLHEYYENQTWTFDNFESLFESYSKVATEDVDLIAFQKGYFGLTSLYANGVKLCDYNGSEFYCDIADDKAVYAADWALNIFTKYEDIITEVGSWETDGFQDETVLMQPVQNAEASLGLPYSVDFQFSLMPFPSGPDATYGEWANLVEAIRGFGVSRFSDVPEMAAIIINELCDPFEEATPNGLQSYYEEQVFFTELDAEIFLDVGKFTRNFYSVDNEALWRFKDEFHRNTTAAQIISSHEEKIKGLVEEYVRANVEGYVYDQLYGNK